MNVVLDTYTNQPILVCAIAAKTCYSSIEPEDIEISYNDACKLLDKVIKSGHLSVLEHVSFTFHISGVSRALTHQLVRHRMASYSQQSHRYVNMEIPQFVVPPTMDETITRHDGFDNCGDYERDWYTESERKYIFEEAMRCSWQIYNELLKSGVPEEDARYVLPVACTTNIVVTMNARELLHFFEVRMCNRAQWEIRELARRMYNECYRVAPEIIKYAGPRCWTDKCVEDKPCGNPPEKVFQ